MYILQIFPKIMLSLNKSLMLMCSKISEQEKPYQKTANNSFALSLGLFKQNSNLVT